MLENLPGKVRIELTSADIACALSTLSHNGISVYSTESSGDLTFVLTLLGKDVLRAQKILTRRGESFRIVEKVGLYWKIRQASRRTILVAGILFLFILTIFLPTKVLFVEVQGNEMIPSKYIIEQAQLCGIEFGASRRDVRSEKIKNALLESIPQLQWVGVNTSGCVATISVKERSDYPKKDETMSISSLVAAEDGVITSFTATKGTPLCAIGQAVKKGQVLISGYTDCGLYIQGSKAEGEVFAQTRHQLQVVTPKEYSVETEILRQEKKYSVLIGKKRINLYKDSSNLDDSCDKMYVENFWTLPGGLQLPVAIVQEIWTYYTYETIQTDQANAQGILSDFVEKYLASQMIAGEFLSKQEIVQNSESLYYLHGQYACLEMIGRVQSEEIILRDGEND